MREELSALLLVEAALLLSVTRTDGAALESSAVVEAPRVDLFFAFVLAAVVEDVERLSLCAGLKRRERRGWWNRWRGNECLCITMGRRAASGAACLARHAVAFEPMEVQLMLPCRYNS